VHPVPDAAAVAEEGAGVDDRGRVDGRRHQ
jgi:hypothetical protein